MSLMSYQLKHSFNKTLETLVMLAGLRFALSGFFIFTYSKLENYDIENSDLRKTGPNSLKRYKLEEEFYF